MPASPDLPDPAASSGRPKPPATPQPRTGGDGAAHLLRRRSPAPPARQTSAPPPCRSAALRSTALPGRRRQGRTREGRAAPRLRRHRPPPPGERSPGCSGGHGGARLRGGRSAVPGRGEVVVFRLQASPLPVYPYFSRQAGRDACEIQGF